MTDLVTMSEIATALQISKQAVAARAERESWPFTEEPVRGGKRRLFAPHTLPRDVQQALREYRLQTAVANVAAELPALPDVGEIGLVQPEQAWTAAQRARGNARDVVLRLLTRMQREAGCSQASAMTTLLTNAAAGRLDATATAALQAARDPRGRKGNGFPSVRSLKRWLGLDDRKPLVVQKDMRVKPWYALAVALKQRPQKPTLTWVHEQIAEQWNPAWGESPPSYDALARFFRDKFSQIDVLKGQHLGSALKAHSFYLDRDTSGDPFTEVHADGWCTHFTAPHPVTGSFVTLEVWHAHCISTRYVPPFAVGLSESFEVIAKCVEHAIRDIGVMAILLTDSTGSVKNDRFEFDPVTSIAKRAGISIMHPKEVGNSQANGIAENFNTWLDREARELATYRGKGMDSLALKRTKKLTDKMVKASSLEERAAYKREAERMGKGIVFGSYEEALSWLEGKRQKWNNKPHSSLPKVLDAVTRKRRHQTPNEALEAARLAGWKPVQMEEADIVDLFRPHLRKMVRRGTVSPYNGQRYHHDDLAHWNGKEVQVAVDIMDWRQVWVKDMEGRFICCAMFVEAQGRPLTALEAAYEKRSRAQVRRKETQIAEIEARAPGVLIESATPTVIDIPAVLVRDETEHAAIEQRPPASSYQDTVMWLWGEGSASPEKKTLAG